MHPKSENVEGHQFFMAFRFQDCQSGMYYQSFIKRLDSFLSVESMEAVRTFIMERLSSHGKIYGYEKQQEYVCFEVVHKAPAL